MELPSQKDAYEWIEQINVSANAPPGVMAKRFIRLGNRKLDISLSSRAELLSAIFPRARKVLFDHHTGSPTVLQRGMNAFLEDGFKGFIPDEELNRLLMWTEFPHKVGFLLLSSSTWLTDML